MSWDPEAPPDPAEWLALDEDTQRLQIEAWHEQNPTPALHPPHMNPRLHATMHAIVERQLAADDPPVVRETMERLLGEGIRRHPALHAVARVLTEQLHATMTSGQPFDGARYAEALRALRPDDAIRIEGLGWMDDDRPRNRAERRKGKKRR